MTVNPFTNSGGQVDTTVAGNLDVNVIYVNDNAKDAVQQMEMQLHEQFAQNYNSTLGASITLFCTLLSVLYGYGYVFLHSQLCFSNSSPLSFVKNDMFTLEAFVLTSSAAIFVLYVIKWVCLYLGYSQRMEQFVINAIRQKYYKENPANLSPRIFPSNYTPFGKDKYNFIVGIYGELIPLLSLLQLLLCIVVVMIFGNIIICYGNEISWSGFVAFLLFVLITFICLEFYRSCYNKYFCNYKKRSCQFKEIDFENSCNKECVLFKFLYKF